MIILYQLQGTPKENLFLHLLLTKIPPRSLPPVKEREKKTILAMNSLNTLEGNQHLLSILTDKHDLEHLLASGSYSSPSFT